MRLLLILTASCAIAACRVEAPSTAQAEIPASFRAYLGGDRNGDTVTAFVASDGRIRVRVARVETPGGGNYAVGQDLNDDGSWEQVMHCVSGECLVAITPIDAPPEILRNLAGPAIRKLDQAVEDVMRPGNLVSG